MGEFSKWLLHEDQKELFDYLFAVVLNMFFLALITLMLWPLGKASFALHLAKGYWVFWTAVIITSTGMVLVQRLFRMDLDSRFNAYVIAGLILSGFLQIGWSAFVALAVRTSITSMSVWLAVLVTVVGIISCYVATVIVGAFYAGALYRMVNLLLAIFSFIMFTICPAFGVAIYGWFFDLVRRFEAFGLFG